MWLQASLASRSGTAFIQPAIASVRTNCSQRYLGYLQISSTTWWIAGSGDPLLSIEQELVQRSSTTLPTAGQALVFWESCKNMSAKKGPPAWLWFLQGSTGSVPVWVKRWSWVVQATRQDLNQHCNLGISPLAACRVRGPESWWLLTSLNQPPATHSALLIIHHMVVIIHHHGGLSPCICCSFQDWFPFRSIPSTTSFPSSTWVNLLPLSSSN